MCGVQWLAFVKDTTMEKGVVQYKIMTEALEFCVTAKKRLNDYHMWCHLNSSLQLGDVTTTLLN